MTSPAGGDRNRIRWEEYPAAALRKEPLYRFFQFPSGNDNESVIRRATVRAAIVDRRFRFARPRDFGDPFDCRPHFRIEEADYQKFQATSLQRIVQHYPNDPQARKTAKRELMMRSVDDLVRGIGDSSIKEMLNTFRILCLVGNRSALEMWSYYADGHRGVCIHLQHDARPIRFAQPIKYSAEYPVLQFPFDDISEIAQMLVRKASVWDHEDEYRIITPDSINCFRIDWVGDGIARFPPDSVTGVTVGCRMPSEMVAEILECAGTGSIPVYRAVPARDRFEVAFEPLR